MADTRIKITGNGLTLIDVSVIQLINMLSYQGHFRGHLLAGVSVQLQVSHNSRLSECVTAFPPEITQATEDELPG